MHQSENHHFLGIDLSTQQIKCVIIERERGDVVHREAISFTKDLPDFGTKDGVLIGDDGQTITSPVRMWIKAIDLLFEKLKNHGKLENIYGISGCAQQHGTVYWKRGSEDVLKTLQSSKNLENQLENCFSLDNSPVWMDSSTEHQCNTLEDFVKGPHKMAELTGSRAHHRFSGAQIKKLVDLDEEKWKETERVSLISSFLVSVFIGKYAPIDSTDGSGTNLMDIKTNQWIDSILSHISDDLAEKLGKIIDPMESLGLIHKYWSEKYRIPNECIILPFLGDNPSSLAGLSLSPTDIGISLGTSDTVFFATSSFKPSIDAHVFSHFAQKDKYMGMVCFKNGSLTRERFRKMANCEWEHWEDVLNKTTAGNGGNVGFFFDCDEIAPRTRKGDYLFDKNGEKTQDFEVETLCRAVFESQCYLKLLYTKKMGFDISKDCRILVTGGASRNVSLLQMLADVFGCEVFAINVEDSAALGGAMRARFVSINPEATYHEFYHSENVKHMASPNLQNHNNYKTTFQHFQNLIHKL